MEWSVLVPRGFQSDLQSYTIKHRYMSLTIVKGTLKWLTISVKNNYTVSDEVSVLPPILQGMRIVQFFEVINIY